MAKKSWVERERDKAYWHIGRFFDQFTCIEHNITDIFTDVFNLRGFAMILARNVDIRKKLKLLRLAFEYHKADHTKTLNGIERLHDVRNILAHTWFEAVRQDVKLKDGKEVTYPAGIMFYYIDHTGDHRIPTRRQAQIRKHRQKKLEQAKPKEIIEDEDLWITMTKEQ